MQTAQVVCLLAGGESERAEQSLAAGGCDGKSKIRKTRLRKHENLTLQGCAY